MGICAAGEDQPERDTEKRESGEGIHAKRVIRLALLGAGESGKTTLSRQMRSTYGDGFSKNYLLEHRNLIRSNLIKTILTLIEEAEERNVGKFSLEAQELIQDVKELDMDDAGMYQINEDLGYAVGKIWRDPIIQQVYTMRSQFQLDENAKHFLDLAEMICRDNYRASQNDIIRNRVRTVGRSAINFEIRGQKFEMVDVGGQRSERAKWKRGFENLTSVIFVAALSAYNQVSIEDSKRSRTEEALDLFEQVACSDEMKNIRDCSLILFLNKKDVFKEKLEVEKIPLTVCPAFKDYKGKAKYDEALDYVIKQFQKRVKTNRDVFIYDVCAVDTENVIRIFNSVKKTILRSALDYAGLQ
mmetsp:Transcript_4456/g.7968  ORF Transcript_4456/g.7968 Transcript_4456/m.7968 type:complete len:357 (-) Transcript_4456:174-1244(-)